MVLPIFYADNLEKSAHCHNDEMSRLYAVSREYTESIADVFSDENSEETSDPHRELAWCLVRYSEMGIAEIRESKNHERWAREGAAGVQSNESYKVLDEKDCKELKGYMMKSWPIQCLQIIIDSDYTQKDEDSELESQRSIKRLRKSEMENEMKRRAPFGLIGFPNDGNVDIQGGVISGAMKRDYESESKDA